MYGTIYFGIQNSIAEGDPPSTLIMAICISWLSVVVVK